MNRFAGCLSVLLLAALAAESALSAPTPAPATTNPLNLNSNQPIAVNADTFLADLNGDTGTYTGNVIVTQGVVRLRADEVKVTAPGGHASLLEARGHIVVNSPSGQAVGDTGVYEVAQQMLHLTGNVVLTKEANVMRGSALDVSMATGIAHLTAGSQNQPGRVQGLFVPQQQAGAAPAANPPKP